MNSVTGFLFRVSEWIMRLAFVNILWISFSFLGLIILGTAPSTVAMFTVIRKWIMGQSDIPIFKTFWTTYKNEWLKSNFLGLLLFGIGIFIYIENSIINSTNSPLVQISKYPFFLLVLLFFLVLMYIFPTYVHYNVNLFQTIKNSFLIMLINPFYNIVMILALVLLYYIGLILPPLMLFFGGSAAGFVIMWACYQSFTAIDRKKEKLKST